ncbi:MAG: HEAT repeat domain-containing protein [Polyangiaceae bacterium]|nr:HEAT repeat domain-containing protein [Polyangiaceae bacterium]
MLRSRAVRRILSAALVTIALGRAPTAGAFVWPSVPDQVARNLNADDVAERRSAAARLPELPAGLATPLVLKALGDGDVEVRLLAARAATFLRVLGAGDRVVEWLSEGDVRLRLTACDVLRLSPAPRAVAPLCRVLGDASADVRIAAADTLGMLGSQEPVPALLGHLDDASPEVREAIVRALGRIGDPRAVVPLLGKVQDSAPLVRRMTVRVLGDLADDRATSALLLALRDNSDDVRVEAIDSLGRLGSPDATTAIAPLVEQRDAGRVQEAAVQALGWIGSARAVDALLIALQSDDPTSDRSSCRAALARIGSPAIPKLVAAIQQSSSDVVTAGAALVLGELRAIAHANVIVEAMQRGQLPSSFGLRALGRMRHSSVQPHVLERLDDPSAAVRRAAIDAANNLLEPDRRDGLAVDPIVARLSESRLPDDERVALTRLLGRTGSHRAKPTLIALAKSEDVLVRRAALEGLGEIGSAGQDAGLMEALADNDPEIRFGAAIALSKVAAPSTAPALLDRMTIASEQDRAAVGIALSGALANATDATVVARVVAALDRVSLSGRDVLLEGLGRARAAEAGEALAVLAANSLAADDRRKVAEALAGHPKRIPTLRAMLRDVDPSVQANAVWSLGIVGDATDAHRLARLVDHADVAVAGNAVAALGKLASRGVSVDVTPLCGALGSTRAYVRANALAALRAAGKRCGDGARARAMIVSDDAPVVRSRAAWLLRDVPAQDVLADRRALRRCLLDDPSGQVASACREPRPGASAAGRASDPVLAFVVPDGATAPVGRAPFALVMADGLMRLGLADRRGGVFECQAPRGQLELAVPATLVP